MVSRRMFLILSQVNWLKAPHFKNLRGILENLVVTKLLGDSLRCTYANPFGGARSDCTIVPNHYGGARSDCTVVPNLFGGARSDCTVVPNHYGGTRNDCTGVPG